MPRLCELQEKRDWGLSSTTHAPGPNPVKTHLVGVDELQQLRVLLAQLLQHGLQDLRISLHHMAQPLELLVVPQERQHARTLLRAAAAAAAKVRHALCACRCQDISQPLSGKLAAAPGP